MYLCLCVYIGPMCIPIVSAQTQEACFDMHKYMYYVLNYIYIYEFMRALMSRAVNGYPVSD